MERKENGITLIALVVTIIVMLLLAGVTIAMLTGNSGGISQAVNAKESTEIETEKEQIRIALQGKMPEKLQYGTEITEEAFREELANVVGVNKNEVSDIGNEFEVKFIESGKYYHVDKEAGTIESETVEKDEHAGDITKDTSGNLLDGSKEHPYEINCIEDLMVLSIMTGSGNSSLNINRDTLAGKYVILTQTLNFKANSSYKDPNSTIYGDINQDGIVESIKTELTKQDEGCIGFPGIGKTFFEGNFDGKNNYIKNLYQNDKDSKSISLFINIRNAKISNLNITGEITGKWHASGIVAGTFTNSQIDNCSNYANITGYNMASGIASNLNSKSVISNCNNYGKIYITGRIYSYGGAGGIAVCTSEEGIIENCSNNGIIDGFEDTSAYGNNYAGIVGVVSNSTIQNCSNNAKCKNGIAGWVDNGENKIINCYNTGECINGIVGCYRGASWNDTLKLDVQNCYNIGKCSESGIIGYQGTVCASITLNMENCYNAGESPIAIIKRMDGNASSEITRNISNIYYDNTKSESGGAAIDGVTALDTENMKENEDFVKLLNDIIGENSNWKKWVMGSHGYPAFE